MRKLYAGVLLSLLIFAETRAQDFLSDSLRTVYTHTKSDSVKVVALTALAKNKWSQRNTDTAIILLNTALDLAKTKGLVRAEIETMTLLGTTYRSLGAASKDFAKGYRLTQEALALARKRRFKAQEIDAMSSLAAMVNEKPDSAKGLRWQALGQSQQYGLVVQQVNALTSLGSYYAPKMPDSAKYYFLQALAITRREKLTQKESPLLRIIAGAYSLNHWGDSSHLLMTEAIKAARQNYQVDQEMTLLKNSISSEGGFFIKDSFGNYYERLLQLARQFHRDTLRPMSLFTQTSTDIGNYPKALQTSFVLLHAYEANKDSSGLGNITYGIGKIYQETRDYKKSIRYLQEAKKYGKQSPFTYIFVQIDLAWNYLHVNLRDSARYYAGKAYETATEFYGSTADIYGGVLNDLGSIYSELNEDKLAMDYLRRSYVFFTTNDIQYLNYCASTMGLATHFKKIGMADSSLYYARLCLHMAQDKGFLPYISQASKQLADYFEDRHNIDSAYYYRQIGFKTYQTLYNDENGREFQNLSNAEEQRAQDIRLAKKAAEDQYKSNLRLYALLTALGVAIFVGMIIFRNNRQKQRSYDLLKKQKLEIDLQKEKLEASLNDLQVTQSQLIQSEKMASLGELTAGIAHEIQNPLNFVNNFSEVNTELIDELQQELDKGNLGEAKAIASNIKENEQKINHHGKRADGIVKGMLQHSRSSSGVKEPTDLNTLADEYLRLSYHGLRAKDKAFNAAMKTDFDPSLGKVNIIPQDVGRVILNLFTNAFYSVTEKKRMQPGGYEPTVWITTRKVNGQAEIRIRDNGMGVPQKVLDKIFQPFFTTKPTGQGTGLGLSMSYDIITKGHGGELIIHTEEGEYAEFTILLPLA